MMKLRISKKNIADMDPSNYFAEALSEMKLGPEQCPLMSPSCGPMCKCSMCTCVNKSTRSMMTSVTNSTHTDYSDDSMNSDFHFPTGPILTVKKTLSLDDSVHSMLISPDDYMNSVSDLLWIESTPTFRRREENSKSTAKDEVPSDEDIQKMESERDLARAEDYQLKVERDRLRLVLEEAASAGRWRRLLVQKAKLAQRGESYLYD